MTGDLPIVDEADQHRFAFHADGEEAQLVYRRDGRRLILVHTEVPETLGGRGIGGRLVVAAADAARANGWVLAPWCPFARRWLEDHAEDVAGLEIDWAPPPG